MKKMFIVAVIGLLAVMGCGQAQTGMPTGLEDVGVQETAQAINQRATALLAQGQVPAAVETFQQAIVQFPDDPIAYFSLAQIYMKIGSFDNAIAVCQRLLEKDPDNGQIYLIMAGCFDLKNEPQKAIELVKTSIAIFEKQNDTQSLQTARQILERLLLPSGTK